MITEKIERMVRRTAYRLTGIVNGRHMDREDLEQELRVTLLEALPRHDPERGPPEALASRIIRGKAKRLIRQAGRQRKESKSCNDPVLDGSVERVDLVVSKEKRPAEYETALALDVEAVLNLLPEDLSEICRRLVSKPPAEVQREMGLSAYRMRCALGRIRKVFEENDMREYLAERGKM